MSYEAQARKVLATGTNLSATTRYYPDAMGLDVRGRTYHSIFMACSGGVTCTIEATDDPEGDGTWLDVTKSCKGMVAGYDGAASWVDTTGVLVLNGFACSRLRVKSVTSDASNSVAYTYVGV